MQQTSQVDIAPLLDKGTWSSYQKIVLAISALIIIFDGVDIQVIGVAIPALMAEWGLPRPAFAIIAAVGLIGMVIGSIIGGFLGDKIGRRPTLIGSVFVFGILSIATAYVNDIHALIWIRLLTGIGLGGALPNATAMTAEFTPLAKRAQAVILTIICVPLGGVIVGLLAQFILPTSGWRTLFIVCGIMPLIVGVVLIFILPESPRFLVRRPQRHAQLTQLLARMDKPVPAGAAPVDLSERDETRSQFGALFSPSYKRDTLLLWLAFFTTLLATYTLLNWLPALLSGQKVDIAVASSGITYYNFGGIFGSVAAALLIGRLGSKKLMLGLVSGGILSALYLSQVKIDPNNTFPIIAAVTVLGTFLNATQTSSYALAAHVYISHIRATGTGSALAIGRIGAVMSSYAGSYVIGMGGSVGYFGMVAISLAITFFALTFLTRHVPENLSHAD